MTTRSITVTIQCTDLLWPDPGKIQIRPKSLVKLSVWRSDYIAERRRLNVYTYKESGSLSWLSKEGKQSIKRRLVPFVICRLTQPFPSCNHKVYTSRTPLFPPLCTSSTTLNIHTTLEVDYDSRKGKQTSKGRKKTRADRPECGLNHPSKRVDLIELFSFFLFYPNGYCLAS